MHGKKRDLKDSIDCSCVNCKNRLLACFIDRNGICKICGHDHRFRPTFDDVKTSIDMIPKLFQKKIFGVA